MNSSADRLHAPHNGVELAAGVHSLVSIMIAAYNAADTLSDTLDSVLQQTYRPIEVVIVNDGSTDCTGRIADEFAARASSAAFGVVVHHQENRGLLQSRNVGLRTSQGEFLQFLDADDILHPEKVTRCVETFTAGDWDVVVPRTDRFRTTDELRLLLSQSPTVRRWKRSELSLSSVTSNFWYTIGPLFRRSIVLRVGQFPHYVHPVVEEMEFHGRVKLETRRIRYLPWVLNFYRVGNSRSVTSNFERLYRGRLEGASIAGDLLVDRQVANFREWASLFRMSLKTYSQTINHPAGAELVSQARESWLDVSERWHPWFGAICAAPSRSMLELGLKIAFRLRQRLRTDAVRLTNQV